MKSSQKNIIIALLAAAVIIILAWVARPSAQTKSPAAPGQVQGQAAPGALLAEEKFYDFGTISMAAGRVNRIFKVTNTSSEPVVVSKLYTSCMCTTASLRTASQTVGPFGMPGHGFIPSLDVAIAPSETAEVEVVFDPAAHGPAGVGRVSRIVYLESRQATPVELSFTVNVTP